MVDDCRFPHNIPYGGPIPSYYAALGLSKSVTQDNTDNHGHA